MVCREGVCEMVNYMCAFWRGGYVSVGGIEWYDDVVQLCVLVVVVVLCVCVQC